MRIDYLTKLNLAEDATDEQIKKAYRTLAKRYHPDISKEPNAKEKFLEIAEAYEMLINYPSQINTGSFDDYFDFDFEQEYQPTARERAEEQSRKNYETFKKNNLAFKESWYYYPAQAFVYLIIGFIFLIGVVLLLGPLYYIYYIGINYAYFYIFTLPGSAFFFKYSIEMYNESRPYFKSY